MRGAVRVPDLLLTLDVCDLHLPGLGGVAQLLGSQPVIVERPVTLGQLVVLHGSERIHVDDLRQVHLRTSPPVVHGLLHFFLF